MLSTFTFKYFTLAQENTNCIVVNMPACVIWSYIHREIMNRSIGEWYNYTQAIRVSVLGTWYNESFAFSMKHAA